jgi:hypothetical protein
MREEGASLQDQLFCDWYHAPDCNAYLVVQSLYSLVSDLVIGIVKSVVFLQYLAIKGFELFEIKDRLEVGLSTVHVE